MKIAVLSDSHDHTANIRKVVEAANLRECDYIFHLGDMVAPFAARAMAGFRGIILAVFGNNDGEKLGLQRVFNTIGGDIYQPPHQVELENRTFVLMHEPLFLEDLKATQKYDFLLYGHLHRFDLRHSGRTTILNPGETGGWTEKPSFCIIDTETGSVEKCLL